MQLKITLPLVPDVNVSLPNISNSNNIKSILNIDPEESISKESNKEEGNSENERLDIVLRQEQLSKTNMDFELPLIISDVYNLENIEVRDDNLDQTEDESFEEEMPFAWAQSEPEETHSNQLNLDSATISERKHDINSNSLVSKTKTSTVTSNTIQTNPRPSAKHLLGLFKGNENTLSAVEITAELRKRIDEMKEFGEMFD